jgi:hypothetical protein
MGDPIIANMVLNGASKPRDSFRQKKHKPSQMIKKGDGITISICTARNEHSLEECSDHDRSVRFGLHLVWGHEVPRALVLDLPTSPVDSLSMN